MQGSARSEPRQPSLKLGDLNRRADDIERPHPSPEGPLADSELSGDGRHVALEQLDRRQQLLELLGIARTDIAGRTDQGAVEAVAGPAGGVALCSQAGSALATSGG